MIKIKKSKKERNNFQFENESNHEKKMISENIYQQLKYQEFINCKDIFQEKIILEINESENTIKEYQEQNVKQIKVQPNNKEQIKDIPDKINNIDKKDIYYLDKDKNLKLIKIGQNTDSEFYFLANNGSINESYKSEQEGDEIQSLLETSIKKKKLKMEYLKSFPYINSILYLLIIFTSFFNLEKTVLSEPNSIFFNINQTGCHRIYFSGNIDGVLPVNIQPERIYVNGEQISPVTDFYCFEQIDNTIEFQWDSIGTDIGGLFHDCSNITKIDLSKFGDSSNIVIMHHLFSGCSSLTSIDFTNFKTDSCKTFSSLFLGCFSLKELNLTSFDTSNGIYLDYMFDHCYLLTSLDITNFNTEKANYMHHMFSDCHSLTSLDLSYFNTENVKSMILMFAYCYSLSSLDLSKFNTSSVDDLRWMFVECKNLSYLDISSFNTNIVTNMDYMFYGCESLTSLDLFHFKTNKVIDIQFMFHGCFKLKYLNISNFNTNLVENMKAMFLGVNLSFLNLEHFNTSKVKDMSYMFYDCISLTSLSISNFDTRNVQDMTVMFYNCSSLSSLNLSNFDTSSVTSMHLMFSQCRSLEYLDLSNFKNDKLKDISWMFYECYNLSYINLSNFKTSNVYNMGAMFVRCWKLTSLDLSSFNTSLVNNIMHMFEDCHNLTSLDLSNFDTNSIEDMKAMFLNCSKLTSLNLENFLTPKVSIMNHVFFGCYDLKYINLKNVIIKDDDVLINNMINNELKNPVICMKDENSLNKIISLYECPFPINCLSGNWGEYSDSIFPEDNNKCINNCLLSKYESDCYEICSYYIYFDENSKKYLCTKSDECPDTHSKLIPEKNECVKPDITTTTEYKLEFSEYVEYYSDSYLKIFTTDFVMEGDEIEYVEYSSDSYPKIFTTDFVEEEDEINCPWYKPFLLKEKIQKCVYDCKIRERQNEICITDYINKKDDNFSTFDIILYQTRNELIINFDKSVINGNIIKEKGINISITQTNQLNNNNDYYLNFSKCEEVLKYKYNLSENDPLYILRIDSEQEGMKVPSFYYELFYLNNETKNLEKADLLFCKGIKIDIVIPINLTGNIDEYNATSGYYNDICYTADSDHGTDIILSDRQNEFIDNNMSICEPNCDFVYYNNENKKAVCSCDIKTEIPFMANLKFDKNVLKNNFMDIKNLMNIKLMKCYKTVFQFKKILKNYGFFIYIIIILINFICFLLFIAKYFKELVQEINKIKISIINFNEHNLRNINYNKKKKRKKK